MLCIHLKNIILTYVCDFSNESLNIWFFFVVVVVFLGFFLLD